MARSDAEEFTELVNRRWPALVRTARLLGCSPAEAEDVAQTALTRCYQHWSRVRRADEPDAYVHRVLVNAFVDSRRRRSRGELVVAGPPEPLGSGTGPEAAPDDHETRLDLERALGSLTLEQRVVVVLRYYLDLSERQTADVLGVPAGTVKSRLSRGLDALGAQLRPDPDDQRGTR